MNIFWLYLFILFGGMMQTLGNSMNAQLRNSVQNPWLASLISFFLILVFFICAFAIMPRPIPSYQSLTSMPWWAPFGGLAGAFAVFAGLTLVDKIGAGPFTGLLITANVCTSLVIDHFGLLNMPIHSINLFRLIGGALMILGIILISKN